MVRTMDRPMPIAMVLGRIEGIEDLLCGVLGYPWPGVGNRNFREPPVSHGRHGHGSDVASNPFRIKLEKTCCNWIGSPLIRREAPLSLLRRAMSRAFASGARNLSVSAT